MADRSGELFGNYRLVRLLGQGGFAEVYLGQHVRLELQAAIKVLHAHLSGAEAAHFFQEAQTIAKLTHPAIVRVFDYDVQDGVPFLVMDYAPGGSLRQRYPRGTLVPLPQIVSHVGQVASGLQYAHSHKFIHRDVKPENMLLGRQEEVVLSDFGLAALSHSSGSLSTKEASGTLAYMAPEQIEGHPRAASDQYALGCVLYEWLCGSRPFEGSPTEVMVQQLSMPPQALHERAPTIPPEVEQVVLRALAKDPKARFATVADFAAALEQASRLASPSTAGDAGGQPAADPPLPAHAATVVIPLQIPPAAAASVETPADPATPVGLAGHPVLAQTTPAAPWLAMMPAPVEAPAPPPPGHSRQRRGLAGLPATLLIGLVLLVVVGGVLGSLSLLAHFGVIGTRSSPSPVQVARGGTWIYLLPGDVGSLIPNEASPGGAEGIMDQALYLPLFYGDAQGVINPGAASEVPTIGNSGVSADTTTWTFHLRPHLVWSDGQPYDARDVDFTWRLWSNPKFGAANIQWLNLISSADVSADHLSITFHLKQPFAPFLSNWVDGIFAPLPAHHFSTMAPEQILKSSENLNPQVVSGPFTMRQSLPGDHYTVVRNPNYYLARQGLPYLDQVVFTPDYNTILELDNTSGFPPVTLDAQTLQTFKDYTRIYGPTQSDFEALYFNFHNQVLASHLEVRKAMAIAVDQQTIIAQVFNGQGTELCTDHPSAYHPGYEPNAPCPVFSLSAANQLLDDAGWVRGSDGVRSKGGQRLEFEYSTSVTNAPWRVDIQSIIQRDFQQIGIKLDIQNYAGGTLFGSMLPQGKASPPSGAVAGRYDIAEFAQNWNYDPDDSGSFACNQIPPAGYNIDFYCNTSLDKLFAQEQATVDPGVRQRIFVQIHQIYLSQFPFITLYGGVGFNFVRKGTHNFLPGPYTTTYNIAQWWCDHGKC